MLTNLSGYQLPAVHELGLSIQNQWKQLQDHAHSQFDDGVLKKVKYHLNRATDSLKWGKLDLKSVLQDHSLEKGKVSKESEHTVSHVDDSKLNTTVWNSVVQTKLEQVAAEKQVEAIDEDAYLTIVQLVNKYGFVYDDFQVTTPDGYQLTVQRVQSKTMKPGAQPVFLQHGLFSSSETWVVN